MPDINYGLLGLQQQAPQQAKQVTATPGNSTEDLGRHLQGLLGVQAAKSAQSRDTIAKAILGQPQGPQTAMMGDGGVISPNYKQPQQATAPQLPNPNAAPETQLMSNSPKSDLSIQGVYKAAQDVYKGNPTMARLATSQAIQESRLNGTPSSLASKHNNLFGIKGIGSAGSVTLPTHEFVNGHMVVVPQQFAAYKTPRDSMIAHKALMSKKQYSSVINAGSVEEGAQALQDSGYATDPNYAKGLTASSRLIPTEVAENTGNI